MKLFPFVILFLFAGFAFGQNRIITSNFGNLTIQWDESVQKMIQAENCPTEQPEEIKPEYCRGSRIQLFYSKDRKEAEEMLKSAKSYFPELIVNLDYVSPDYKVKAGYFSSRENAQESLKKAKLRFSSSLIVDETVRCSLID